MNRQPVLEGERLLLRPLEPGDWDALYAVAADPLLWEQHPMHDRWREPVFRAFFDEALAQGGALAVIERASGRVVGSSRYLFQSALAGSPLEIGWTMLARDMWGGAANAEMKRLMLGHAFESVDRVVFRIGEENRRSRRAMEKIGGQLTDEREEAEHGGRRVVHLIYEITREGFAEGPLSSACRAGDHPSRRTRAGTA